MVGPGVRTHTLTDTDMTRVSKAVTTALRTRRRGSLAASVTAVPSATSAGSIVRITATGTDTTATETAVVTGAVVAATVEDAALNRAEGRGSKRRRGCIAAGAFGNRRHGSFVPSVVVFEAEVGDEFFTAQVAQRVLQFHQLDEHVVFRVQARRRLRALEVE